MLNKSENTIVAPFPVHESGGNMRNTSETTKLKSCETMSERRSKPQGINAVQELGTDKGDPNLDLDFLRDISVTPEEFETIPDRIANGKAKGELRGATKR